MSELFGVPDKDFYRLAFPRGRFFKKIEDDLAVFVQLIDQCAGLEQEQFNAKFDAAYRAFHDSAEKTVANHRSEMITLFGLTIVDQQKIVWPSGNAKTLLETQDFPLFFKAFCNKFQFPNCINIWPEAVRQANAGVAFKPAAFILQLFIEAAQRSPERTLYVSSAEISNLVFNDLRVARGVRTPKDVLDTITTAREGGHVFPGGSNLTQHGREFLQYMTLANILKTDETERRFCLNTSEAKTIQYIIKNKRHVPFKAVATKDEQRKTCDLWDQVFKIITPEEISVFNQQEDGLPAPAKELKPPGQSLKEIGDAGELYVLKHEKELIGAIRPDKLGLVARVANDTSLGYDIQSLELPDCTRKKYIEVKTTSRTYPPSAKILAYFLMSGNEWETARHHQDDYYIYCVVLLPDEAMIHIIKNPTSKEAQNKIILEAKKYRVSLKHNAVDAVYSVKR